MQDYSIYKKGTKANSTMHIYTSLTSSTTKGMPTPQNQIRILASMELGGPVIKEKACLPKAIISENGHPSWLVT